VEIIRDTWSELTELAAALGWMKCRQLFNVRREHPAQGLS
jgi:hypothetical protein